MSNLTRTLGFKTTELFFQEVITVAGKQGLNRSDFVRNAVVAAIKKAELGLQASPVVEPDRIANPVIESTKREVCPGISSLFFESQKQELLRQIMITAGLTKMLQCLPILIQLGSNGHLASGVCS